MDIKKFRSKAGMKFRLICTREPTSVCLQILIIFSPRTRVYLLRMRFRLVRRDAVETIVRRSKVGDWFLLYMLGENLDTVIYRDVMHELANKLASRHHHGVPGVKGELQEA